MDPQVLTRWAAIARRLAYFTIAYNLLEAAACGVFGIRESSLSLFGFGADSLLEAASGGVVLWRFTREGWESAGAAEAEHRAQKLIGGLLLGLSAVLAVGALWSLWRGRGPESGLAGTAISLVSLAVMGVLFKAKMRSANALNSAVLSADAFCTKSCMWLSAVLLVGSFLVSATHYVWFDALASLGMAWLVGREGWENWRGGEHGHGEACDAESV